MATGTKPNKAEFMKAGTPAEAARVLGHVDGGKKLRARLRSFAGKQADNPERFSADAKEQLWGIYVEGKEVARSEAAKETSKKSTKRSRKAKAETK